MKVVLLSNVITLEQNLKDILKHHSNLKVEQSSHRTFILKKRYWRVFWNQVAWMDTSYRTIRINEREWKRYGTLVMELARSMEKYAAVREMVIEVRP